MALFADDTSIIKSGKTYCNMQNDLDKICDRFNYNKMSLKTSKRETMSFGNNFQNTLTVQHGAMPRNTCCKYLGVLIDSNLTYRDHISYAAKKLNKICGLINRVRKIYPIECLLMYYNAYAKSLIAMDYWFLGERRKRTLTKLKWHRGELPELLCSKKV